MAKNKTFKEVQKFLETQYFSLPLDKTTLAILKEEEQSPFLLITYDPKIFDGFILSFSVNYNKVHEALNILLEIQNFGPVVLEEQFFINKNGSVLFGEEAEMVNNPLFDMEMKNKEIH